jgi:SH3 domain-containing protein
MTNGTAKFTRLGWKGMGGVAACLIALVVVYFGFGIGGESPKKSANASAPGQSTAPAMKPVQAMNLALGNMVYLAQDLGFTIKTANDTSVEGNKIALRIERHLQRLRELYRQESGKNSTLVGSVLLQFEISPSGEVSQVKELSARVSDGEFKSAILAEVAKWSFAGIVPVNLTVTCPLLFVREGMDITTLVTWEKSLADPGEKAAPVRSAGKPAAVVVAKTETTKIAKSTAYESQVKYSTSLRKNPDFASPSLTTIGADTRVTVLNKVGDWLEVRAATNGPIGFIRKEFVKPVEVARE